MRCGVVFLSQVCFALFVWFCCVELGFAAATLPNGGGGLQSGLVRTGHDKGDAALLLTLSEALTRLHRHF